MPSAVNVGLLQSIYLVPPVGRGVRRIPEAGRIAYNPVHNPPKASAHNTAHDLVGILCDYERSSGVEM